MAHASPMAPAALSPRRNIIWEEAEWDGWMLPPDQRPLNRVMALPLNTNSSGPSSGGGSSPSSVWYADWAQAGDDGHGAGQDFQDACAAIPALMSGARPELPPLSELLRPHMQGLLKLQKRDPSNPSPISEPRLSDDRPILLGNEAACEAQPKDQTRHLCRQDDSAATTAAMSEAQLPEELEMASLCQSASEGHWQRSEETAANEHGGGHPASLEA